MKCLRRMGEFFLAMAVFILLLMILKQWQEESDDSGSGEEEEKNPMAGRLPLRAPVVETPLPTNPCTENFTDRR